ncbi:MAG: hypothetical protein QF662_08985, partial [Phycisphaerae bacterium]|nr:hypothetical protein [Phycisphaerae bacterium]
GNFLLRRFGRQPLPTSLRLRDYAVPLIVCLADRLLIGVTLWFVARSVTDISVIWMPFFISAAALAMTSGFLAVFAPAGIGVQEGIFMLILTPLLGEGSVAIVIVAMRLTQIVVEVVFAGIGTIMLRLMRDKGDGE